MNEKTHELLTKILTAQVLTMQTLDAMAKDLEMLSHPTKETKDPMPTYLSDKPNPLLN